MILGGKIADPGSAPWLGSIQDLQYGDPIHFCGAVIINRFYLLTAAHCVVDYPAPYDNIKVVVGEFNLAEADGWEVDLEIKRVIIHPGYDMTYFKYDVALLQVKDHIPFNTRILPIWLPYYTRYIGPRNNPHKASRELCDIARIYGWGKTDPSGNPVPILRKARIPLLTFEECRRAYGAIIEPPMMCAGNIDHGGVATCTGDWGGPLVGRFCKHQQDNYIDSSEGLYGIVEDEDKDYLEHHRNFLMGIASWSIGCGLPGYPNVYIDVEQIMDWILDTTRSTHPPANI